MEERATCVPSNASAAEEGAGQASLGGIWREGGAQISGCRQADKRSPATSLPISLSALHFEPLTSFFPKRGSSHEPCVTRYSLDSLELRAPVRKRILTQYDLPRLAQPHHLRSLPHSLKAMRLRTVPSHTQILVMPSD